MMSWWLVHEWRETAKVIRDLVRELYESWEMEEIVELVSPGLSREAFEQSQLTTLISIATRHTLRAAFNKGASLVRDGFLQTRRTQQLLQLLDVQLQGQNLCNPQPGNPNSQVH